MLEEVAALVHEIWANWMSYMFSKGTVLDSGAWEMPSEFVERWVDQGLTPYSELSEEEKESDREIAGRYLARILGVRAVELKRKRVFIASFAAHKEPKIELSIVTTTTSLGAWISHEPESYAEAVEMAMIHAKERFPESEGYSGHQVAVDELSEEFLKGLLE